MITLKILCVIASITLFFWLSGLFQESENHKFFQKKQLLATIPLIVFVLLCCVVFIPSNTVGIKWSAFHGTSNKTLEEGIHIKSPLDKIYLIDTKVQERTIKDVTVQTKDAQFVTTVVNVKFKVDKDNAYAVYKGYGTLDALKKNIVSNYSQKAIESVVTQYDIISVLGDKKNEIYDKATDKLEEMLSKEGVDLVQLTIKDMDAGDEIENAIKEEAIAKKQVETAEQNRLKAEKDAETKVIKAKGEAEANKILTEELTDAVLQDKWIEKWNGKLPSVVTGSDDSVMIGIDK